MVNTNANFFTTRQEPFYKVKCKHTVDTTAIFLLQDEKLSNFTKLSLV